MRISVFFRLSKKHLLFSLSLICAVNFGYAQKYGYASYNAPDKDYQMYVSQVVDLSSLDCSGISHKLSDGTDKEQTNFYNECCKKWYTDYLRSKNIKVTDTYGISIFLRNWDLNKEGDLFTSKDVAEKDRLDYIKAMKQNKFTVTEVGDHFIGSPGNANNNNKSANTNSPNGSSQTNTGNKNTAAGNGSQTNTTGNTQQQQKQQQADTYLNQANNNTPGIQQAYDYNMAKINAAAAGNNVQVQQIQQLQNQQIQGQLNDLGKQVGNLITLFSKKRPAQLTVEEKLLNDDIESVRIIDQVAESSSTPHDRYGNYIRNGDIVANNEKQNPDAGEMYNNGVVENGKFHNGQKSMEWFIKAANHNSPRALVRLATLAEGNGNCTLAANLYLKAALLIDSLPDYEIRDGGLDFDDVTKAIKSLSYYDENGYFVDDNWKVIDCDGYKNRKTNYLQAAYFQYKTLPYTDKFHFYYHPLNAIADLFLKGDSTLQKNIPRAVDYYTATINTSKYELYQIYALEGLARIFETGNDVKKDPAKAIEYYSKVISVANANRKNYSEHIKGAEKAIKRCEKLAKDITTEPATEFEITGAWKCVLSMPAHQEEKPLALKMNLEKDNNGFITATLSDDTPNGTISLHGFMAGNKMHLLFNKAEGYQLDTDLVIISGHEIKGTWSSYKIAATTKQSPFTNGINLTLTR